MKQGQPTWRFDPGRIATVTISLTERKEVKKITDFLRAQPKLLNQSETKRLFGFPFTDLGLNLLSIVLQTSFTDHPSTLDILRMIEERGGFPNKQNPI